MGPASYLSWLVGAGLALILALLLAEIASMFKQKALFARLLTLSHDNPDFGFVVALSSWLGMVIVIPAEAAASVQYLSTVVPSVTPYIFQNGSHTFYGSLAIILFVIVYTLINFWGIKSLAKVSNILAVLKIIIPVLTALILMAASFNPGNFTSQGFAPYGLGRVFSAVVVCGIFYAFYGFSMVAMYCSELENPKKNIPRALVISVFICLSLYLLLQTAFIAALPPKMIAKGWSSIHFTSPLAQLLMLFHLHILAMWAAVLYFDATVSPSGTGIIYMGSSSRTLTGMARDKQLPKYFDKMHPIYHLSRRSLLFTATVCSLSVLVFKNWQEIMIIVTVFQLISCVAIPVAFVKLRSNKPEITRHYRAKFGLSMSYFIYMVVSYLLTQATVTALILGLTMHLFFFAFYSMTAYDRQINKVVAAFKSSWTIFLYMLLALIFGYLNAKGLLDKPYVIASFFFGFSINYWLLLEQKNHTGYDSEQTSATTQ